VNTIGFPKSVVGGCNSARLVERRDEPLAPCLVHTEAPNLPSVTLDWPTADFQEREVYDMFGVVFDGHPDLRRILMPEDYEGFPQRRDFPVGGEPVLFTEHAAQGLDYTLGTNTADPDKLATTGEE